MILRAGTELKDPDGNVLCRMSRDWDDSREKRWAFDMVEGFDGDIRDPSARLPVTSALLRLMDTLDG